MENESTACVNTDRDLFILNPTEGYYSPRVFATKDGGIGMDVGGHIIVKTIREWHKLAEVNQAKG